MKVVLIDDEQLSLDMLERLLASIENVEVVEKFTDPIQASSALEMLQFDVVFLDMEMGDVHGLTFAEQLMMKFHHLEIVFVTAHSQYALKAFEVNAIDYLLKPVKPERLQKTVHKLQEKVSLYDDKHDAKEVPLYAKTMGNFQLVDANHMEVKWRTRKVKELFVYLWHHRENASSRTKILEDLWGELTDEKASALMHTTVYELRKKMKEIGIPLPISLVNEKYVLNFYVKNDLQELVQKLNASETTSVVLEKVIELYQGDYLEEENYSWAAYRQQKVKQTFLHYLEKYLDALKNDTTRAHEIEICLNKMLQIEPYNERFVYLLLDHYGSINKKKKMVNLYHSFKSRWVEELGIDVPKEIIEIYRKHISD